MSLYLYTREVFRLKKSMSFVFLLFISILVLSGCTTHEDIDTSILNSNEIINSSSIAHEKNDSTIYKYEFDINDIKEKKSKKKFEEATESINDSNALVNIGGITHKINSVSYYDSVDPLKDNYYELPSGVEIVDKKINSNHVLVMVNIDYQNNSDEEIKYYLNSFHLIGITSEIPWEWLDVSPYYHDKVEFPQKNNRSYFKIYIPHQETHNGVIGFFVDKDIIATKNIYLRMSADGSANHNVYIKLPVLKAGTESEY